MTFSVLTDDDFRETFGKQFRETNLFPSLQPVAVPAWLPDLLERYRSVFASTTDRAREATRIAPVLLAAVDFIPTATTVFAGHTLDEDPARGLSGECDHILAWTDCIPRLADPIATVTTAVHADIDASRTLGIAHMLGIEAFNRRTRSPIDVVYGCVTCGDVWQFMKLAGEVVYLDQTRYSSTDLGRLLAAFRLILLAKV